MQIMKSVVAALIVLSAVGCSTGSDSSSNDSAEQRQAALEACGLEHDDSITADVDLRACDPEDAKKTTICHVPPGNPANAHTLCVGNAAVSAHLHNHADTKGACVVEDPCGGGGGEIDAGVDAGLDGGVIL